MTACDRPVSAKIMPVVYTQETPYGIIEHPQGRRVVFTYEDGSHSWLGDAYVMEPTHADAN